VGDVRTSAQIDKRTASVDGRLGAIRDSLVNEVFLVLAVLEHLKELVLGHLETLKGLLGLYDAVGEGVEGLLVLVGNSLASGVLALGLETGRILHTHPCWPYRSRNLGDPQWEDHCRDSIRIVVRQPLRECGRRSARRPSCLDFPISYTIHTMQSHASCLFTFGVFKVEKLKLAGLLQGSGQIPQLAVNEGDDGALEQGLGDALCNGAGSGFP
jgi:hypothetical protein